MFHLKIGGHNKSVLRCWKLLKLTMKLLWWEQYTYHTDTLNVYIMRYNDELMKQHWESCTLILLRISHSLLPACKMCENKTVWKHFGWHYIIDITSFTKRSNIVAVNIPLKHLKSYSHNMSENETTKSPKPQEAYSSITIMYWPINLMNWNFTALLGSKCACFSIYAHTS